MAITPQRAAVIGLGSMGYGMAISLRRAGLVVTGCDVNAANVERFVAEGGQGAPTPADAARDADIAVSVVVNAAQTEAILFGKDGVADTLPRGAVFVSSATMDPDIARRLAASLRPVIVTVHSFTPLYFGRRRDVELGVIHDADATFALAVLDAAQTQTSLNAQLNAPYSAADDVTHTLRLQATPYGLLNVMLEIRNDLLADARAEKAMADTLAPVLSAALDTVGAHAITSKAS